MNPPGFSDRNDAPPEATLGAQRARVVLEVEIDGTAGPGGWVELLANIRRLAGILMERLEEGSREKTLDQAQTRMLSSTTLKALRLWQEVLNGDDDSVKDFERVRAVAKTLRQKF